MPLKKYSQKRDFKKTTEPKPKTVKADKKRMFVVQKHHASHQHYDFRYEWRGVLKSWAIPKGPSNAVGVKRLAVQTEDHPLAYGKFEGIIPEGEYGAGTVKIWDTGEFIPLEVTPTKSIFELKGRNLKGKFCLVFFKGDKDWLFFRMKD